MNKFLSIISLFLFSFGMFNVSYADCGKIDLTCTQDLKLSWTSTGQNPSSCVVGGSGWSGFNECNSQNVPGSINGEITILSANIPEGTSYYTFSGQPIVQPPTNMTDTCTVTKPTGCNSAGTYSISANPNPVKICSSGTLGSSNISWTAPEGQNVDVWVVGNPNKFANVIGSGFQTANWIQVGVPATFQLKKHNSSTVEASVTVTGTSNGCSTGSGYCGDLIKQTPNSSGVNEQCDAGSQNGVLGSGCSSTCTTETTSPLSYYCNNTTNACSSCGGTTGVACPSSGTIYSSNVTCSNACADLPSPSANIGFDGSYSKNKTITLPAGQTTTDVTLYMTSANISSGTCDLQQYNAYGNNHWNSIHSGNSRNQSIIRTRSLAVGGPYSFRYVCSGATSEMAQLTINQATASPDVSCIPSPQTIPATFNWAASGFSKQNEVTCTVAGEAQLKGTVSGSFSKSVAGTYLVSCSAGMQNASANCVAQTAPVCGNSTIESGEQCDAGPQNGVSGSGCSSTCQNENDDEPGVKLNSTCESLTIPSRITTGSNFIVTPTFENSGTVSWTNSFSAVSSGSLIPQTKYVQSTINQFGTFSPSYSFTAPSLPGSFTLSFSMRNTSNVPFGDTCNVNGSFVLPECRDGVDNDGDEIIDFVNSDPGCSSADDDDETDPASGATLKISANPQLVRYGGSSNVSYEVGNCKVTDGEGKLIDGTWELKRDGSSLNPVISGIGTTSGSQTYPVSGIQNKTTFTLSCGGTTRSATISVIKINEI